VDALSSLLWAKTSAMSEDDEAQHAGMAIYSKEFTLPYLAPGHSYKVDIRIDAVETPIGGSVEGFTFTRSYVKSAFVLLTPMGEVAFGNKPLLGSWILYGPKVLRARVAEVGFGEVVDQVQAVLPVDVHAWDILFPNAV